MFSHFKVWEIIFHELFHFILFKPQHADCESLLHLHSILLSPLKFGSFSLHPLFSAFKFLSFPFIWIVECDFWASIKLTKLSRKMNPTFLFQDEYLEREEKTQRKSEKNHIYLFHIVKESYVIKLKTFLGGAWRQKEKYHVAERWWHKNGIPFLVFIFFDVWLCDKGNK